MPRKVKKKSKKKIKHKSKLQAALENYYSEPIRVKVRGIKIRGVDQELAKQYSVTN